jgi:hypothetical protein
MKLTSINRILVCIGTLTAINASAAPIQAVLFEGDYGSNRNSALGRAPEFHIEDQGDFNGDGATDTRRFIPILFPYPGLNHGPIALDFQIDQDLFGKSGFFYTGAQIVSYSAESGVFPSFGLYRWGAGPQAIQLTSGNVDPTDDMGFLGAIFAVKENFLNGAGEIEDLKLPNEAGAFFAEVFFRGLPMVDVEPAGLRRARFLIQAGDKWYVSQTGTESDGEVMVRDQVRTLSVNPAAEYWHEYNVETMLFIGEEAGTAVPAGATTRGDALSDIRAVGVIMQNTRFDGTVEGHYVWLNWNEFSFHLDPDPEPLVADDGWTDTGDWLGLIYDFHAPWVYSMLIDGWIYLPEQGSDASGGWLFIPAAPEAGPE